MLRAFVEVVRSGGFSSAAKVLFATQSAVSKTVRQLEDEVGLPLLDRVGRRTVLTPAGEVLYQRGLKLLAERDDLMAEIAEMRGLKRGALRLGLPPIGSNTLFAPLFSVYRQRYPGIEIRLVEHGSDRLEESLRAGELDFAGLLMPVSADFNTQKIQREPLTALLHETHPLAKRRALTLQDLRDVPFILFQPGFTLNRVILSACRSHGFTPTVTARSSQLDFIVALVAAGIGVAFLPRMIALQRRRSGITCVRLSEPGTDWDMTMAWRRDAYLSHAAKAWLGLVRELGSG